MLRWLGRQVRELALRALGIDDEVRFVRVHRRELEELRILRDDVVDALDTLAPRMSEVEARAIVEQERTERAWPPAEDLETPPLETRPAAVTLRWHAERSAAE